MPYIIGVAGKREAGKSTYASLLRMHLESYCHSGGPSVFITSFAEPVREVAKILVGEYVAKEQKYSFGGQSISGRMVLETVGTGLRNLLSPNLWVSSALKRIVASYPEDAIVIFDDVRFLNEAAICDFTIFVRSAKSDELGVLPSEQELHQVWAKSDVKVKRRGGFYDYGPETFVPRIIDEWQTYTADHEVFDSQSTAYGG